MLRHRRNRQSGDPLDDPARDVRAGRVHIDRPSASIDDKVHVFQRNRAQKHFIPEYQCTHDADPVLESDDDGADIRHADAGPDSGTLG